MYIERPSADENDLKDDGEKNGWSGGRFRLQCAFNAPFPRGEAAEAAIVISTPLLASQCSIQDNEYCDHDINSGDNNAPWLWNF